MKRKQTYEEKLAGMTDREFAKEWEKVMKAINPRRNVVILAVTPDDLELPIAVADTVAEMSQITGVKKNSLSSMISNQRSGRKIGMKFYRVGLEE